MAEKPPSLFDWVPPPPLPPPAAEPPNTEPAAEAATPSPPTGDEAPATPPSHIPASACCETCRRFGEGQDRPGDPQVSDDVWKRCGIDRMLAHKSFSCKQWIKRGKP